MPNGDMSQHITEGGTTLYDQYIYKYIYMYIYIYVYTIILKQVAIQIFHQMSVLLNMVVCFSLFYLLHDDYI